MAAALPTDIPTSDLGQSPPQSERLFATTPSGHNVLSGILDDEFPEEAESLRAIEIQLANTSMNGSLHQLQGETRDAPAGEEQSEAVAEVMQRSLEACHINPEASSPAQPVPSAPSVESAESDEDFEDAQESLSPQRRIERVSVEQVSPDREGGANSEAWKCQRKHFFVLSEAGKPIFSQHGDEDELAALTAVMQALVSYVIDMGDSLKSINVSGKHIVFLHKGPLILVAVTRGGESVTQLIVQLTYIYHQILSIITLGQLTRIFERKPGFDLRKMLAGSERLLNSLAVAMDSDPSFMLSAVRVLPLAQTVRDDISKTVIQSCHKIKNLVFAIMMADNKLVALIRMKRYYIHPADLHLLFNLVNTTESFKHSEAWLPICLPKFDSSGFVHAHISYLSDDCQACLLLITAERDIFFELSEAKRKIVEAMGKNHTLQPIVDSMRKSTYTPADLGLGELRHFLYKSKNAAQFTAPSLANSYQGDDASILRLHAICLQMQHRLHAPHRPLKLIYRGDGQESVLGWVTQTFELYAAFPPDTSKAAAIKTINSLLKWCKREETSLFILNAPTFH